MCGIEEEALFQILSVSRIFECVLVFWRRGALSDTGEALLKRSLDPTALSKESNQFLLKGKGSLTADRPDGLTEADLDIIPCLITPST